MTAITQTPPFLPSLQLEAQKPEESKPSMSWLDVKIYAFVIAGHFLLGAAVGVTAKTLVAVVLTGTGSATLFPLVLLAVSGGLILRKGRQWQAECPVRICGAAENSPLAAIVHAIANIPSLKEWVAGLEEYHPLQDALKMYDLMRRERTRAISKDFYDALTASFERYYYSPFDPTGILNHLMNLKSTAAKKPGSVFHQDGVPSHWFNPTIDLATNAQQYLTLQDWFKKIMLAHNVQEGTYRDPLAPDTTEIFIGTQRLKEWGAIRKIDKELSESLKQDDEEIAQHNKNLQMIQERVAGSEEAAKKVGSAVKVIQERIGDIEFRKQRKTEDAEKRKKELCKNPYNCPFAVPQTMFFEHAALPIKREERFFEGDFFWSICDATKGEDGLDREHLTAAPGGAFASYIYKQDTWFCCSGDKIETVTVDQVEKALKYTIFTHFKKKGSSWL